MQGQFICDMLNVDKFMYYWIDIELTLNTN